MKTGTYSLCVLIKFHWLFTWTAEGVFLCVIHSINTLVYRCLCCGYTCLQDERFRWVRFQAVRSTAERSLSKRFHHKLMRRATLKSSSLYIKHIHSNYISHHLTLSTMLPLIRELSRIRGLWLIRRRGLKYLQREYFYLNAVNIQFCVLFPSTVKCEF